MGRLSGPWPGGERSPEARAVAQEIATRELGSRSELEVKRSIERGLVEAPLTEIDREFLKEASSNLLASGHVAPPGHY